MSTSVLPPAPIYIVSVNNTPEVAKKLVGILIEGLSAQYNLVHLANSDKLDGVEPLLKSLVVAPQVLICSSQWTSTQQKEVLGLAKTIVLDIKTIAIPPGLNATKGGDAVVDLLKERFIGLGLPPRT